MRTREQVPQADRAQLPLLGQILQDRERDRLEREKDRLERKQVCKVLNLRNPKTFVLYAEKPTLKNDGSSGSRGAKCERPSTPTPPDETKHHERGAQKRPTGGQAGHQPWQSNPSTQNFSKIYACWTSYLVTRKTKRDNSSRCTRRWQQTSICSNAS
jgi:hypothetical protein